MSFVPSLRIDQWLTVVLLCCMMVLYHGFDPNHSLAQAEFAKQEIKLAAVAPIPVLKTLVENPETVAQVRTKGYETLLLESQSVLQLTASSSLVLDLDSASVLYEHNAQDIYLPASTTKLMTALLASELYSLDEIVTVSQPQPIDGTTVGLPYGSQWTVQDLIQASLISSGNDAAYALAAHHPVGLDQFVKDMNIKAQALGMKSTIYENPAGFDGTHHQTTAQDLGVLAREVLKKDFLKQVVNTKTAVITSQNGVTLSLYNTNQLLHTDPRVHGFKTGTTEGAGQVLITLAEQDGHAVIIVLMNSQDRFVDTRMLIDWTFSTYTWLDLSEFFTVFSHTIVH